MTTWYRLSRWGKSPIERVEVVKETAQTVVWKEKVTNYQGPDTFRDTRTHKSGEFFRTFEDAKSYRLAALRRELQNVRDEASRVSQKIAELGHMIEADV